jgi:NADH dehydrogenase (ubiquinone) flavoprotein 2
MLRQLVARGPFRGQITRTFKTNRPAFGGHLVQHQDTASNNADTPFEFNEESKKQIEVVLKKFPSNYKQSAVMPLLYIAQEQDGANWLPLAAMNKIAEVLDIPRIRVYEVATFYTMYNRTPVGKYHIQLCGTTPCMVRGAQAIKQAITDHVGIKEGETSADGLFTLQEVECLGACVNAPMIQVNNKEFYEHLTPENMKQLLDDWKAGKTPKAYNQNGIHTCEGPMGQTTLKEPVDNFLSFRDLDKLKADLLAEREEAAKEAAKK